MISQQASSAICETENRDEIALIAVSADSNSRFDKLIFITYIYLVTQINGIRIQQTAPVINQIQ